MGRGGDREGGMRTNGSRRMRVCVEGRHGEWDGSEGIMREGESVRGEGGETGWSL